jgi:hypothetical protein
VTRAFLQARLNPAERYIARLKKVEAMEAMQAMQAAPATEKDAKGK